MPRIGRRVITALFCSTLSSLGYLGLALYQLFEIAQQDKLMFILLVGLTVGVLFWCTYLASLCCSYTSASRWHVHRITLPLWELVYVLIITILAMALVQINGYMWWQFDEMVAFEQATVVVVLSTLGLKLISALVLSEVFHRSYVMEGYIPQTAYSEGLLLSPTAPHNEEECY